MNFDQQQLLTPLCAVFGCGILVLIPVRNPAVRKWLLAGLNLLFLRLILSGHNLLIMLALLGGIYALLKLASTNDWRRPAAGILGALTLVLFFLHKLPSRLGGTPGKVQFLLSLVGFSYVTLRIFDLLRAVFERRQTAPGLCDTINYLVPFHMMLAGPIQSYDDYVDQPAAPPPPSAAQALAAMERFARGAFKKFVLALILQKLFLTGYRSHGWHLLLEIQVFYIWLFLDFSGLSDIAIGVGALLGLRTPENFNQPYLARNMINFWERWHISLSQFIRANLFTPLQLWLARRAQGRHALWCASGAFTVSFGLCGLWHGLTMRYFLWGLLNAFGLLVTNIYRHYLTRHLGAKGMKRYLANQPIRICATVVTFEFVALSLALIGESV
jgi:alginate O-acetyltransferase complex protein AlgI